MKTNPNIFFVLIVLLWTLTACQTQQKTSPNILWISCEDITTMLGTYGDPNANTPHLDKFSRKAVKFTNAFATAPVCSPSRSCLITGVYATTMGTQHLRSSTKIPKSIQPFPKYLKEAGYFVTNNHKEDYNFTDGSIWDDSSTNAHWRSRNNNQPFFSVFNFGITHQSGIFGNDSLYAARIQKYLPNIEVTHPDALTLPPYYPDTPEIRKLWARYYTNTSIVDYQFSQVLKELEEDGLDENTIVFFFSDHGTGMPRSKRALYDSGLKIPLLIHVPSKWQNEFSMIQGTANERMVSFVDFAPTMLAIAEMDIPDYLQGTPFISRDSLTDKPFVFGASDRVDEAYEMSRTIRTKKYRYVRNLMPHLPLLQPNFYTDKSEIMQELRKVPKASLNKEQLTMFAPFRMPEELYDVETDPYEVHNLASNPSYSDILIEMRNQLEETILRTHDSGLMPEPEMIRLSNKGTPYDLAHDVEKFPIQKILAACNLMLDNQLSTDELLKNLRHPNGFVRYWTLMVIQNKDVSDKQIDSELIKLLDDEFPTVRMEAEKMLVKKQLRQSTDVIESYLLGDNHTALYAARTYQSIARLSGKTPELIRKIYNDMSYENENGGIDKKNFYRLYTYWALKETFEIKLSQDDFKLN